MKISFCSTCMGRRHHLEQTLPKNLEAARAHSIPFEFVVIDYNSPDGLGEWLLSKFRREIDSGEIVYARTTDPRVFRMAHAKNVAHRLADGPIVINLDADNFLSEGYVGRVHDLLSENPAQIVVAGMGVGDGGRIALSKPSFVQLGGYDEAFTHWGRDDKDFLFRAIVFLGLPYRELDDVGGFIDHGDDERFAYQDVAIPRTHVESEHQKALDDYQRLLEQIASKVKRPIPDFLSRQEVERRHRIFIDKESRTSRLLVTNLRKSIELLSAHSYAANENRPWGQAQLKFPYGCRGLRGKR